MWNCKENFIKQAKIYTSTMLEICVHCVEKFLYFFTFPHFVKSCGVNVKKYMKKGFYLSRIFLIISSMVSFTLLSLFIFFSTCWIVYTIVE